MGHYVPHTESEIASMLEFLGLETLNDLFDTVPQAIRLAGGLGIADGLQRVRHCSRDATTCRCKPK